MAFLYPILGLIMGLIFIPLCCSSSANLINSQTLPQMIYVTIRYAFFLIIPSLTVGFLIAFLVIVPITLAIRYSRKKRQASEAIS